MSTIEQLLSDFIDAWNAGRRPRVREYLARLPEGADRDALADQLTSWLELAPTPSYDEHARQAIRQERAVTRLLDSEAGLWPSVVPTLRERAGLSIADLAHQLVDRFSLDTADADRTAGYLTRLERGHLDPARVSRRLLDALGSILGVHSLAQTLPHGLAFQPAPAARGGALFRAAAAAPPAGRPAQAAPAAAPPPAASPPPPVDAPLAGRPAQAAPAAAPPPAASPPPPADAPLAGRPAEPAAAAPTPAAAPAAGSPPPAGEPDQPRRAAREVPAEAQAPRAAQAERLAADLAALSHAARTPAPRASDELDRLFTGGPDA